MRASDGWGMKKDIDEGGGATTILLKMNAWGLSSSFPFDD